MGLPPWDHPIARHKRHQGPPNSTHLDGAHHHVLDHVGEELGHVPAFAHVGQEELHAARLLRLLVGRQVRPHLLGSMEDRPGEETAGRPIHQLTDSPGHLFSTSHDVTHAQLHRFLLTLEAFIDSSKKYASPPNVLAMVQRQIDGGAAPLNQRNALSATRLQSCPALDPTLSGLGRLSVRHCAPAAAAPPFYRWKQREGAAAALPPPCGRPGVAE